MDNLNKLHFFYAPRHKKSKHWMPRQNICIEKARCDTNAFPFDVYSLFVLSMIYTHWVNSLLYIIDLRIEVYIVKQMEGNDKVKKNCNVSVVFSNYSWSRNDKLKKQLLNL